MPSHVPSYVPSLVPSLVLSLMLCHSPLLCPPLCAHPHTFSVATPSLRSWAYSHSPMPTCVRAVACASSLPKITSMGSGPKALYDCDPMQPPCSPFMQPPMQSHKSSSTVASNFKRKLMGLVSTLGLCQYNFVRCIKPNRAKAPMCSSAKAPLALLAPLPPCPPGL